MIDKVSPQALLEVTPCPCQPCHIFRQRFPATSQQITPKRNLLGFRFHIFSLLPTTGFLLRISASVLRVSAGMCPAHAIDSLSLSDLR